MSAGVLPENHGGGTIRAGEPRKISGDSVENVPVGYRVERGDISLVVKKYVTLAKNGGVLRAVCYCNRCGNVTPALKTYTEKNISEWLDMHISLFQREHGLKKN